MTTPSTVKAAKGLDGIIAASTRLSDVKGDIGELTYCGYNINELAGKVSYEEVVFLLHYGHLPDVKELAELKTQLASHRDLPKGVIDLIKSLPKDTRSEERRVGKECLP